MPVVLCGRLGTFRDFRKKSPEEIRSFRRPSLLYYITYIINIPCIHIYYITYIISCIQKFPQAISACAQPPNKSLKVPNRPHSTTGLNSRYFIIKRSHLSMCVHKCICIYKYTCICIHTYVCRTVRAVGDFRKHTTKRKLAHTVSQAHTVTLCFHKCICIQKRDIKRNLLYSKRDLLKEACVTQGFRKCICIHIHMCMGKNTYVCVYTHTHTRTHTHTHTHTRTHLVFEGLITLDHLQPLYV